MKISAGERSKTVCLVTTQSFNEGSLDARTRKRSLSLLHKLFVDYQPDYHVFQDLFKP